MTLTRLGYNIFFKGNPNNRLLNLKKTHLFVKTPKRACTTSTMPCKEVSQMSDDEVKKWVSSFDTVMTDCDGVLWVGGEALPGSPDVIQRFRALGKKVFYVTNNSTKHRKEYKAKFDKLGFGGEMDEIIGTAYLAAAYLEDIGFDKSKSVYVVGSTGITQELDDIGVKHNDVGAEDRMVLESSGKDFVLKKKKIIDVGGVILGFTHQFSYSHLMVCTELLSRPQCLFIAPDSDNIIPVRDTNDERALVPGTGAFVAAVETAACRKPTILGKPSKYMFEIIQHRHPGVDPARTLMIGDRANTDILLGKNCGLQTLLVGTGCHSLEDTRKWEVSEDPEERRLVADYYSDKLGDLLERMSNLSV